MACYCCSRGNCQPGCECHRYPPNVCRNCEHKIEQHGNHKCQGAWNPGQDCPCDEFMLDGREAEDE